jgi:Phosphotransferase enzyme family
MTANIAEHPGKKHGLEIPGTGVTLDSIFSGHSAVESAGLRVQIISQNGVPRWVLPEDTRRAITVLKSWKPYKAKSRLQWSAVVAACRLNALAKLPGVRRETLQSDLSYWRKHLPGFSDSLEIVAYVGNPFPTRKALLFFIDEQAKVRGVAKTPIYAAARTAILSEARILTRLRDRLPVPRVLFYDEGQGIAAQSWMEGVNVSRRFGEEHLELLTGFASENARTRLSDCREEFEGRIASLRPIDSELMKRALSLLDVQDELRACVEHGDFVPWNLRRLADGRLTLIDWEWAVEEGFPWQDVCRYFYLQDYLFREGGDVWKTMMSNPLLRQYRREFELSYEAVRGLTTRFLLRYLCEEQAEGNQERVEYAMQKIREVVEAMKE